MKTLTVLYDDRCAFCRMCCDWLMKESQLIPLRFLPRHAEAVEWQYPGIDRHWRNDELIVVSDDGAIYKGDNAFIVCLFALKNFRALSRQLATPLLKPAARRFFESLSDNREALSCLLQ